MDKYIKYFGELTKEDSKSYTYPCPLCRAEGHDTKGDNLKIKKDTGLMTCFKSLDHTKILRENYQVLKITPKTKQKKIYYDKDRMAKLENYLRKVQIIFKDSYKSLIDKRGFSVDTFMELQAGFDHEKNCWVFPVFHYPDKHLIGFEYRDKWLLPRKEGGHVWREPGTFSCLCQINSNPPGCLNKVILEGFIDCYLFYQHCKENNLKAHILTGSCGINSIVKNWNDLDVKHSLITLAIDNDKAGNKAREQIKIISKFCYQDFIVPAEYKDFGEMYIKVLKKDLTL